MIAEAVCAWLRNVAWKIGAILIDAILIAAATSAACQVHPGLTCAARRCFRQAGGALAARWLTTTLDFDAVGDPYRDTVASLSGLAGTMRLRLALCAVRLLLFRGS